MTPWVLAGLGLLVLIGGAKIALDLKGAGRSQAPLTEEQEWALRRAGDPGLGNS